MPKNTINQTRGRLSELRTTFILESNGIAVIDMTSRDFGLDVTIQLPEFPLPKQVAKSLSGTLTEVESETFPRPMSKFAWEMSSNTATIQIKSSFQQKVRVDSLRSWVSSNRQNGSNYLIVSSGSSIFFYDDFTLDYMWNDYCNKSRNQKTISLNKYKTDADHIIVPEELPYLGFSLYGKVNCPLVPFTKKLIEIIVSTPSYDEFFTTEEVVEFLAESAARMILSRYSSHYDLNREFCFGEKVSILNEACSSVIRQLGKVVFNQFIEMDFTTIMLECEFILEPYVEIPDDSEYYKYVNFDKQFSKFCRGIEWYSKNLDNN